MTWTKSESETKRVEQFANRFHPLKRKGGRKGQKVGFASKVQKVYGEEV